ASASPRTWNSAGVAPICLRLVWKSGRQPFSCRGIRQELRRVAAFWLMRVPTLREGYALRDAALATALPADTLFGIRFQASYSGRQVCIVSVAPGGLATGYSPDLFPVARRFQGVRAGHRSEAAADANC